MNVSIPSIPSMPSMPSADRRVRVEVRWQADADREIAELRSALAETPRRIPSKYFYDPEGSALFERITELPEYYLTRAERAILDREAGRIAERTRASELVELGSGAAEKTRILLDALSAAGHLRHYIPLDVDEELVRRTAEELAAAYPALSVHGLVEDFTHDLSLPRHDGNRLVLFLGSTIGNLARPEAVEFLTRVASELGPGDHFLLGLDLAKDPRVIEAAYNDSAGLTARFNRNVLAVLNDRFGADFEPERFAHRAFFNRERSWIEMRLASPRAERVRIEGLSLELELQPGEELLTEISTKYRKAEVSEMVAEAGLELRDWLCDPKDRFALALIHPARVLNGPKADPE